MNENDDDKFADTLQERAAQLPTAVAPKRDLWPDIERAINTPAEPARTGFRQTLWAQAAAVLLMVGASSALTYTVMKNYMPDPILVVNEPPTLVFKPVSGSFGSQYNLGPDYQDVRRDLAANLEAELGNLQPDTRAAVTANIATIRQAINDINLELAEEPDNVLLQELLLSTYRDELALMIKVDEISTATMRRDDI